MPLKHHFICRLPNGVHARPASSLEEAARGFSSELMLFNERTGRTANSKSVLSIIGADIRYNDRCLLTASGQDEREAMAAMTTFVDDTFPHCDDALPAHPDLNGKSHLPPSLRNSNAKIFSGVSVVPGVARGELFYVGGFKVPSSLRLDRPLDAFSETRILEEALQKLASIYERRLSVAKTRIEAGLIKAHRSIARDMEFRQFLLNAVRQRDRTVAGAILDTETHFSGMLAESDNALLRERVLDIQDVCQQLLQQVYGSLAAEQNELRPERGFIVVAEALTPSQFLSFDRRYLKGLVLGQAGSTSHTVILARSFGIPTLTGVRELAGARFESEEAVVDASAGVLILDLNEIVRRYYTLEQQRTADRRLRLQHFASRPAATKEGHRIEVAANIASADEVPEVLAAGAEAVGLFRTEMLFFDRDTAPGEAEQFEIYRQVVSSACGKTVIIRTLDVGGDKQLDYLNLPAEENPFLGHRAVRLYKDFEAMFRNQIRALVRASAFGSLKILIPMVSVMDEVRWVRKIIGEEQARCAVEKLPYDSTMQVGAMVEVPAAALNLDAFCKELDFFSIGSNDLLQYLMAADRANTRVAGLYNPLQPAFLRLLKQIVHCAKLHQKWIGLCGEMGGQIGLLPLLVGLELDELSVTATAIAPLKAELSTLAKLECKTLLEQSLKCSTAEEVSVLLDEFAAKNPLPIIDPELIILDADVMSKEEAIKVAVNRLYVLDRIKEPRRVEELIWQREYTYSTGFGHGFAIPHCKTNAIRANSLVVVKLRNPVDWNSLDGQPVRVVILLVLREVEGANGHMKVFAKLARKMMNENFRAHFEVESDAIKLCKLLTDAVKD